ncbi:MAG: hypothetical protein KDC54_18635 [Lewinella sp.]|nr:hypothetical protein [Lewinella sp.]
MSPIPLITYTIILCSLTACLHTEDGFEARDFLVQIPHETSLSVTAGKVEVERSLGDSKICLVRFDAVNGGKTLLFGKIQTRESNGYTAGRLKWMNETGQEIRRFSIDELQALPRVTIDSLTVVVLE